MKKVIVVILLFVGLAGFSQDENKTDVNGKKQGLWKKYHPNGMTRYIGNFKNDKPTGVFKYYYDDGHLQIKMVHKGSETYSQVYYETGEIKAAGKYEEQEKDSIWRFFDKEGYKISEEFYLSGKREGVWKSYYNTGQVAEEKEYSNDFEEGKWNQYFVNGKQKLTATYENGVLEGRATYFSNGGIKSVTGVFVRGTRNGFWTFYEQDGKTVRAKQEYLNGKRIDENKDDDVINPNVRMTDYYPESVISPENFMPPR
jgi:antitoxin component YwqK of YwqJK toxin-antitoxin module